MCTEHTAKYTKHTAKCTKHTAKSTKHTAKCTKHTARRHSWHDTYCGLFGVLLWQNEHAPLVPNNRQGGV